MEKSYTLRNTNAKDLFLLMRIVNKIGINEVKKVFSSADLKRALSEAMKEGNVTDEAAFALGMQAIFDIACVVVEHIPDCESEIYTLLSNLSGKTVEEIAATDAPVFVAMIMDVFKEPWFADFFSHLFGSFKQAT